MLNDLASLSQLIVVGATLQIQLSKMQKKKRKKDALLTRRRKNSSQEEEKTPHKKKGKHTLNDWASLSRLIVVGPTLQITQADES